MRVPLTQSSSLCVRVFLLCLCVCWACVRVPAAASAGRRSASEARCDDERKQAAAEIRGRAVKSGPVRTPTTGKEEGIHRSQRVTVKYDTTSVHFSFPFVRPELCTSLLVRAWANRPAAAAAQPLVQRSTRHSTGRQHGQGAEEGEGVGNGVVCTCLACVELSADVGSLTRNFCLPAVAPPRCCSSDEASTHQTRHPVTPSDLSSFSVTLLLPPPL